MAEKKMPADSNAPANNKAGTTARRTRARYNTPPAKMNAKTEIELVEDSFAQLTQYGERLAIRFYERLFEQHEELAKVFGSVSMDGQQKKFFASLVLIVQSLRQPEVLEDYLRGLGARHHHYGVKASYYAAVENNLLAAMAEFAGDAWTHEVNEAWANTLNRVTTIMKAASSPEHNAPTSVENKRNEPASIDAELAQFKAILDNVRTPIMIIDRELIITYANLAMIELLSTHENMLAEHCPALASSSLIGTNIQQFHPHPDELAPFLSSLANLPHRMDIEIGNLSFNLNISALLDTQGRYIGNVMEWSNVTESKHRDAIHDAQLAALNTVMNVATMDLNGIIVDANDNFLNMMAYDREDLLGQTHQQLMPTDHDQHTAFWERLQQGQAESGEFRRVNRYGEEVWWQGAYTPVLGKDGEPAKVMIYVTDMTESKLRHVDVEEKIDAIDKTMSVISYDMNGTILSANQQFLDAEGYRKEEVVGRHHSMFVEPDYAASHDYQVFWDNLRQGQPEQGEFKWRHRDGKEKWIHASYHPVLDMSGNPIKVVRYATDITLQKSAQSEVEALLDEINAVLVAMSEGDLTKRIAGTYDSHFTALQNTVNNTSDKMNKMAKDIVEASGCIGVSVSEIATDTTDLRQRAQQQSQAVEDVIKAISIMAEMKEEQLNQAGEGKQLAEQVQRQAEKTKLLAAQVQTELMTRSERDQEMAYLLEAMSNMIFKTNLLALNAAVEAAKVGEQGRGFALITSEIRQITQRSAEVLKEAKMKLFDHREQTNEGEALAAISVEAWQEVASGSRVISNILSKMMLAEEQQAQEINQVNSAASQMREMTDNNAELVQKMASASQLLKQKEHSFAKLISFLQTE